MKTKRMVTDWVLDILGDYFVEQCLENEGWEFHQFVEAWQRGYIEIKKTAVLIVGPIRTAN